LVRSNLPLDMLSYLSLSYTRIKRQKRVAVAGLEPATRGL
jgi:hypothetical protein